MSADRTGDPAQNGVQCIDDRFAAGVAFDIGGEADDVAEQHGHGALLVCQRVAAQAHCLARLLRHQLRHIIARDFVDACLVQHRAFAQRGRAAFVKRDGLPQRMHDRLRIAVAAHVEQDGKVARTGQQHARAVIQ